MLREYFNDNEGGECGVCDICMEKKKLKVKSTDFNILEMEILGIIKQTPIGIEELILKVDNAERDEVIKVVRWLMDIGKMEYDSKHILVARND
jgi:ATP-dependent DNA helicase RecQ